jgi:3',5'-cyclic AMP phosphodiesterase CpdA
VAPGRVGPLLGKRVFGWLSWRARRGSIHRTEVLEALLEELTAAAPDQIVITGDLTNVSLEEEFVAALDWLRRIGDPQRVTAIPGNHDAYVPVPRARSWDLWAEYLVSDSAGRGSSFRVSGFASPSPSSASAPRFLPRRSSRPAPWGCGSSSASNAR